MALSTFKVSFYWLLYFVSLSLSLIFIFPFLKIKVTFMKNVIAKTMRRKYI